MTVVMTGKRLIKHVHDFLESIYKMETHTLQEHISALWSDTSVPSTLARGTSTTSLS